MLINQFLQGIHLALIDILLLGSASSVLGEHKYSHHDSGYTQQWLAPSNMAKFINSQLLMPDGGWSEGELVSSPR